MEVLKKEDDMDRHGHHIVCLPDGSVFERNTEISFKIQEGRFLKGLCLEIYEEEVLVGIPIESTNKRCYRWWRVPFTSVLPSSS